MRESRLSLSTGRIEIPPAALVDELVSIRLSGFAPHQPITLQARLNDDLAREWTSWAVFRADAKGAVDVGAQKPLSGTYDGVDPMGLFWSMTLAAGGDEVSPFSKTGLAPATMTFLAQVGGQPAASATLTRLFMAPDIVRTSIREQGLVGTLFQPSGPGLYPGVIILGGSVGGLGEETAALLASHGLVSLALAYFATDGLPEELVNIPLEYFATALAWLQTVDTIRKDRLAVLGRSRGGELALLLGTMFPQIRAVVAYGGSGLVFAGWGQAGVADQSAWSYRGVPLPFLKEFAMDDPAREQATIPVERIAGPVLLVSGQEDHIWPAGQLSTLIMERLKTSHHPYPDQHLSYPGAGHRIQFPYLPTTSPQFRHPIGNELMSLGGNAKDRAFAEADSWARVLRFLTGNF